MILENYKNIETISNKYVKRKCNTIRYNGFYQQEYEFNTTRKKGWLNEMVISEIAIGDVENPLILYITRSIDKPRLVSLIYDNDKEIFQWTPKFEDIFDPLISADEKLHKQNHIEIMEKLIEHIKNKGGDNVADIVYAHSPHIHTDINPVWITWVMCEDGARKYAVSIVTLYQLLKEIMVSEEVSYPYGDGSRKVVKSFKDYGTIPYNEWVVKHNLKDKNGRNEKYITRKKKFLDTILTF